MTVLIVLETVLLARADARRARLVAPPLRAPSPHPRSPVRGDKGFPRIGLTPPFPTVLRTGRYHPPSAP